MKQFIRIVVLVFAMLLLIGCGNSSDLKEDGPGSNLESTLYTDITDPAVPTANDSAVSNTMPTQIAPAETSAPTDATTMPTETTPMETTAPTDAATMPTETAPAETSAPTDATTMPTETTPMETTAPTFPPATQTPAAAAGFDAVYADICRRLNTDSCDFEYTYVNSGIMEVVNPLGTKEERYSSITYALDDIDNDGNLEMIVLDAMGNTRILAVFALQNGQPVMTHEGGYRARLYKLSDGVLYFEGSNGAAYSIFGAYGQCWFTYPKGEDQMEIGFYYSADGSYDPIKAQEITADEYWVKQAELTQKIMAFSVYNFS